MLLQREVTRARNGIRHVRLCIQKVERSFDFVDFVEFDFIAKVYARSTLSLVCWALQYTGWSRKKRTNFNVL